MSEPKFLLHSETTFPIGVEYYRGPVPKRAVWDDDFARIRASGLRIVRSFSYWNHMEPAPGQYQLDDFDLMFDLAAKHGLYVWLDLTLATHGACPEWLTREYPDIRAVDQHGQPSVAAGSAACPQGSMVHCYDHPVWQEYGGGLLRHVVDRYKDRPNLLVWGLWDGVSPISPGEGFPCYCENTLSRYKTWLRARFTLDELNQRLLRRYRRWEDVEPPRHSDNVVEMLMYRRFHYENLVGHLRWMVDETRKIDPAHEVRAHAGATPRPWDEH
ncbi:MAG: beta-galactosidase, partial [Candidatus Latescibacteria bacterium]|nr:beta-galactosidase [Candidatus Latescibacterota bacterium]